VASKDVLLSVKRKYHKIVSEKDFKILETLCEFVDSTENYSPREIAKY
jgi:hypothetical protein